MYELLNTAKHLSHKINANYLINILLIKRTRDSSRSNDTLSINST